MLDTRKITRRMEILLSLKEISLTIEDALAKGAYSAAQFCSLSIPDLMGQFYYKKLSTTKRYIKWYDEHVHDYENPPLKLDNKDILMENINQLNGHTVYAIRCKLFHEGKLLHKSVIEDLEKNYNKFIDTDKYKINLNISLDSDYTSYGYSTNNQNNIITINVRINQKDMAETLLRHANQLVKENTASTYPFKNYILPYSNRK